MSKLMVPQDYSQDYSTLEVNPEQQHSTLEVALDRNTEKQFIPQDDKGVLHPQDGYLDKGPKAGNRRKIIIWGLIIAVIAIIAIAVGLGVGLSQSKKSTTGKDPGAAASPSSSGVGQTNTTTGLGVKGKGELTTDSYIAAVNWTDATNSSHYRYHVFFQDSQKIIQETVWDSNDQNWKTAPVTNSSVDIKSESPIAAAISITMLFPLYYFDSDNEVQELKRLGLNEPWSTGSFSLQTGSDYTAAPSSQLAAYWNDCPTCSHSSNLRNELLVLWTNPSGTLQLARTLATNFTVWKSSAYTTLVPVTGSGLALAGVVSNDSYSMRAYYSDATQVKELWGGSDTNDYSTIQGPDSKGLFIGNAPTPKSPPFLASASWGHNTDVSWSRYHQVVSTSSDATSIRGDWWNGNTGGNWSNNTVQESSDWKNVSSLAMNGDRRVYGVVAAADGSGPQVREWMVNDNGSGLTFVGVVNTTVLS